MSSQSDKQLLVEGQRLVRFPSCQALGRVKTVGLVNMAHAVHDLAGRTNGPAFPTRQLFVLALCRICEPIAFMSISPYVYFMVKDFHVTDHESNISFYSGMVTSAFTFAEFSTGMLWGSLSDKIGRKPVLLMGMAGTGLSAVVFGFAPSLSVALLARSLGGFLNGNMGVLQTTVAELVTVKEHQPLAYSLMPFVWCLGSVIGPMIGGALANPVDHFSSMFQHGSVWERFPYLLPNLFCAACVFMSLAVGIFFLDETHEEKKHQRDAARELCRDMLSRFSCTKHVVDGDKHQSLKNNELQPLMVQFGPPGYTLTEASSIRESVDLESATGVQKPLETRIFTRPAVLHIVSFGILAFHTMTFDTLFPVFLEEAPKPDAPVSLPFKFAGGFGYDTATVGFLLSMQGLYSMFAMGLLNPFVVGRVGPLRVFRVIAMSYFSLYLITPYLVLLPDRLRMVGIYCVIIWKCSFSSMAYPTNQILLSNSAPTMLSLGTINGVAASTASLCRGFGPLVSGLLFTVGGQVGYSGLVWWVTALITLAGAYIATQIDDTPGRCGGEKVEEGVATPPVAGGPADP